MQLRKQPKTPAALKPLGIYVHVPFCRSKCEYCDFYSLGGGRNKEAMGKYLTAFNDLLNKRFDEGVKLPAAITAAAGQQNQSETAQPSGFGSLWSQITSGVESGDSSSAFF